MRKGSKLCVILLCSFTALLGLSVLSACGDNTSQPKHIITFDYQGATSEIVETTRLVTQNTTIGILPSPTKAEFAFNGWFTEPNGEGIRILQTDKYEYSANITLYAHFVQNAYNVKFVDFDGTVLKEEDVEKGSGATAPEIALDARPGYTFDGWYDTEGTKVSGDTSYSFTVTADVTLTAKWVEKIEYTPDEYFTFELINDNTEYSIRAKNKNNLPKNLVLPQTYNGKPVREIYSGSYPNAAFQNPSIKSVIIPDGVTSIGACAFSDCSSLTSITIPDGVTSIGDGAFYNCNSLTAITIPDSITSIGEWAFTYCSSLTSITILGSITSIGDYSFYNCSSLTSITIPDSVTSIGSSAFSDCSSLTSITIPDSVTNIGEWTFYNCSSLTSVIFGEYSQLTSIGGWTFYNCSSLTSITIPDSVTSIGACAFSDCSSLTSITILGSIASIGDYSFYNCSSLTSITIPSSVTSIGYGAFYGCSSLTTITIPDSVTSIGYEVFRNCNSLMSVTIHAAIPPTLGDNIFYKTHSALKIYVPPTSVDTYKSAQFWSSYASKIFPI